MSTSTGLWSAAIAAVTALVVALLTQSLVGRRERRSRAEQRLREVQDAALELRNQLGRYGPLARAALGAFPGADLSRAKQQADDAFALVGVKLTRIDDRTVRDAVEAWRDRARFHYVSAEEVTTAEEVALWDEMNATIGDALNRS
jgi:hypothetical protein